MFLWVEKCTLCSRYSLRVFKSHQVERKLEVQKVSGAAKTGKPPKLMSIDADTVSCNWGLNILYVANVGSADMTLIIYKPCIGKRRKYLSTAFFIRNIITCTYFSETRSHIPYLLTLTSP